MCWHFWCILSNIKIPKFQKYLLFHPAQYIGHIQRLLLTLPTKYINNALHFYLLILKRIHSCIKMTVIEKDIFCTLMSIVSLKKNKYSKKKKNWKKRRNFFVSVNIFCLFLLTYQLHNFCIWCFLQCLKVNFC